MDLVRPPIIQRRMTAAAVVKAFDVADDVLAGPFLRGVGRAVDALVLQGRKESFNLAIIPANPGFPHRRPHPQPGDQGAEGCRGINASPVRMPNRVRLDPVRVSGIAQCPFHELRAHMALDRPADDLLRITADDRGRYMKPCQVWIQVMSPTNLMPGRSAVKSHFTRSGMAAAAAALARVVVLKGRGWHGTRPSCRMIWRTNFGEHSVPSPARSAWSGDSRTCPRIPRRNAAPVPPAPVCGPRWPRPGGNASDRTRNGRSPAIGTSSAPPELLGQWRRSQ